MSIVSSLLILLLSLTSLVSATVDGWDYSKGSSQKIRGVNLGSFIDFLSLVLDFQFRLETHVLTLSPSLQVDGSSSRSGCRLRSSATTLVRSSHFNLPLPTPAGTASSLRRHIFPPLT